MEKIEIDGVPMGTSVNLENESKATVPPELAYRGDDESVKITTVLRECCSNAENYQATKAYAMVIHAFNRDWLFFFHNGRPFTSLKDDILKLGCRPFTTKGEGKAFQGNGLSASACAIHQDPLIVVGSNIEQEGGFKVGTGCPQENNEWQLFNATDVWMPKLTELIGEATLRKYSVFYGFKINLQLFQEKSKGFRNYLNTRVTNTLALMAPSMLRDGNKDRKNEAKLTLVCCEKEIGFPYKLPENQKYKTLQQLKSVDEDGGKTKSTGSIRRYAISMKGLLKRYAEGSFEIKAEPFDVYDEVRREKLIGLDATVVVNVFPALKPRNPNDLKKRATWHVVLRDDLENPEDPAFKKGDQREYGTQPFRKAFLLFPWLYDYLSKKYPEDSHRFERFKDNSLAVYKQVRNLVAYLGLPYGEPANDDITGGPYVTVHVLINNIEAIERNGTREPITAKTIYDILGRRSDFTFNAPKMISQILSKATQAAAVNVDRDAGAKNEHPSLRDLCKKYFQVNDDLLVPIYKTEEGVNGKIMDMNRNKNVQFYYLDGDNFMSFDGPGQFEPGSSHKLMAWHKIEERWIEPEELQAFSRGSYISRTDGFGVDKAIKNLMDSKNPLAI